AGPSDPLQGEHLLVSKLCRLRRIRFGKAISKSDAVRAFAHSLVELGIERDRALQQQRRDGLLIEAASADDRLVDDPEIVGVVGKSGANGVEVAERRKEVQGARQQAFAVKQREQPPGPRLEQVVADR